MSQHDKDNENCEMGCKVNEYITKRYDHWLKYATYHTRLSRLPIDPADVLNDVLCEQLEREGAELEQLITTSSHGNPEFDYLILHIIKVNIRSARSKFRYTRGQHCTHRIEDNQQCVEPFLSDDDSFDIADRYNIVREALNTLKVPQRSKQIFAWRFFEDRPYSEWEGKESLKSLYNTYHRIFLKISSQIG